MDPQPVAPGPKDDWSSWEPMLTHFSQTTSCTVTLYGADGTPAIGPIFSSDTGVVLGHSRFFGPDGEGRRFELALAARAALTLEAAEDIFLAQLAVVAVPIVMFGRWRGTIVFGWLPLTFATALGSERVAQASGAESRRLWTVLRLQTPLGAARLQVYARFLSSLVATHARLRETLNEIEAVARMREESLARVAHELRTPLGSVMLRLSALLNTTLEDPQAIRRALEAVIRNVREESRMVDDVVDSARSRTGQLSIAPLRCNLLDVVFAAVGTIAPQAEAKGVHLRTGWTPGEQQLVEGDPARLQQAFWNILANAVKFTPAGGSVTVSHSRREGMHDIAVVDTGAGIRRDMLGQVFDPFIRERANNDTGLGLGLSIARHIIELHGGRIMVDSEGKGRGTTFRVTLPAHWAG